MERTKGFTVIELLIALALSSIVLMSVFNFFLTIEKAYDTQDQVAEMNQNARVAMDRMAQDIRNIVNITVGSIAGVQRLPDQDVYGNTSSGIDRLRIVVYTPDSPKKVTAPTTDTISSTTISVDSTADIVKNDYAVITDRISMEVFQVDSDPTSSQLVTSQLLSKSYPTNSEVYKVYYLDYGLKLSDDSCNCPVLKRKNNKGGGAVTLAENIEDLNFASPSTGTVQIRLVARTAKQGENYDRKRTVISLIKIRNIS